MNQSLLKFRQRIKLTVALVLYVQLVFSQNLVIWELSSATGSQTSNTPSTLTTGINAGLLNRGAGITAIGWPGSMNSNGWFSSTSPTTLSDAITNNDYYQFTLTVADGYKAKVTGIELVLRSSNTGPNKVTLRSSVDNFAADLGTATVTTTALLETMSFTNALTNLTGTITFRLYGYGSAANAGSNPSNTGTLRIGAGAVAADNDLIIVGTVAPTVSLAVSSTSGSEADKTEITLTATTSSNVAGDQTVEVGVSGTGVTTGDYTLSAAKITILSGTKTGSITLTVVDDFEAEATETATITLVNPSSGLELGTTFAQTVEITDNDTKGVVLFESENATKVTEGGANDSYTIVLNSQPTANVSIGITTGTQLTAMPATLTFTMANWNIPQTVTISAVDDATVEENHSATITHTVSSADVIYNGLSVASVSVMITDNDQAFNCPKLTTQNSTSFETCNDNSANDITIETTRNDLSVKLVYFSSAKTGTEMYTGGTVIGNATAPSGASAPFLVNFNDLIFPVNQTGADVTYYVYAILDLEDAELTEASCRPSLQFVITIKPLVTASVVISSDDSDNNIIAGTTVNFTAVVTNGGDAPSFQWKKNNQNVGTSSTTYTDALLADGDVISCVLTSNAVCAASPTATSNEISMKVTPAEVECVLPSAFEVTGGGSFCVGGDGVEIGLANSETGVKYQLKKGNDVINAPIEGTGSAISFGKIAVAGTYTVDATRTAGGCTAIMTESVNVTTDAVSVGGKVTLETGAGLICKGTSGSNSYELSGHTGNVLRWESASSSSFEQPKIIANTSTSLQVNVGDVTETTYYRAVVQNGLCSVAYSDVVSITVEPLPAKFNVMGGGSICAGSVGAVLLSGSEVGVAYSLVKDANEQVGAVVAGMGTSLSFGEITNAGTYTIKAAKGACVVAMEGEAVISVLTKPTISLKTLQQTLNEGDIQQLCDIDANPVNNLQFTVSGLCVSGSLVWRGQIGNGSWSSWSTTPPVSQLSNNQPHRYQAACDMNCPATFTSPMEVTINQRASVPQAVSLTVDGVNVAAGETKEVCSSASQGLLFHATCAVGEVVIYSVDGGEYSTTIPTALVDNQFHNYRVRCRKSDGTASCVESESGVMRLKLVAMPAAPTATLSSTVSCQAGAIFSGQASCGNLKTVWYNALTEAALPNLPATVPAVTTSYYARCQTENGCLSGKSNVVTFTVNPVHIAPIVTVSQASVCMGTTVTVSANCPAGSSTFWNTGVSSPSFEVSFNNVTKQSYWAKCVFEGGCQSLESAHQDIRWNAFVVTLINLGQSQSAVKPTNNRDEWKNNFIGRDGGAELEQSTQQNPTLYFVENINKTAPRYWTINVDACGLGTGGSLTFDLLATPEMGVIRSYNTHENNAPYFMYANREGWTELYGPNHPAYGFYEDNGSGGNVYDAGLPKGLYKLSVRYWDMKGWGSIYPATRKPQGHVLAYQEYWFRIQSKEGVGVGATREVATTLSSRRFADARDLNPNSFATVLPNPVTSILRLQVQESKGQVVQTTLIDASGREVLRRQFVAETNTHEEEFGVSELPTGVYFLKVLTSEKQTTLKVVKVQ